MRALDSIIQNQNKNNKKKNDDDYEPIDIYMDKPKRIFLNEEKGVFVNKDFEGINTEKNIFDKTAVFHVK